MLASFEEVENAMVAYAKEQARRRALDPAVNSGRDSLHLANQLYANGLSSFINVLDAERSLYQLEDALATSDKTVAQNLVALYKALGGGWETEKKSDNPEAPASASAEPGPDRREARR